MWEGIKWQRSLLVLMQSLGFFYPFGFGSIFLTESVLELGISDFHLLLELLQTVHLQGADRTPVSSGELLLNDESRILQIIGLLKGRNIFAFKVVEEYQVCINLTDGLQDCMCDQ